jgi:hypothetical protein
MLGEYAVAIMKQISVSTLESDGFAQLLQRPGPDHGELKDCRN